MGRPVNAIPGKQGFQKTGRTERGKNAPTAGPSVHSTMPPQEEIATLDDLKRMNEKAKQRRIATQPKITPSGGFITATPSGGYMAFDGADDPRHIGTYHTYQEAFTAAEAAAAANIDQPAPEATAPQWREDYCDNGVHPVYGGANWGVRYQDHWDDYQVNHGYYGMTEDRDGHTFIDGSRTPLADNEVRWASDQRNRWDAEIVWQHRELVTAALRGAGYGASERDGVRVRVDVHDEHLEMHNYDHPDRFTPIRINRQDLRHLR